MLYRVVRCWFYYCHSFLQYATHSCITNSFLFFLGTFFEENLTQDFLFLFVRVVKFHVVIVGLVESRVVIVVTVRILIPYPLRICHHSYQVRSCPCYSNLGSQEKHSLVKTTNDWDLRRLLWLLLVQVDVSDAVVLSVEVLPVRGELVLPLVHEPTLDVGARLQLLVVGMHALVVVIVLMNKGTDVFLEAIAIHGRHVIELVVIEQGILLPNVRALGRVLELRLSHGQVVVFGAPCALGEELLTLLVVRLLIVEHHNFLFFIYYYIRPLILLLDLRSHR